MTVVQTGRSAMAPSRHALKPPWEDGTPTSNRSVCTGAETCFPLLSAQNGRYPRNFAFLFPLQKSTNTTKDRKRGASGCGAHGGICAWAQQLWPPCPSLRGATQRRQRPRPRDGPAHRRGARCVSGHALTPGRSDCCAGMIRRSSPSCEGHARGLRTSRRPAQARATTSLIASLSRLSRAPPPPPAKRLRRARCPSKPPRPGTFGWS
jgi:hypothetical protein